MYEMTLTSGRMARRDCLAASLIDNDDDGFAAIRSDDASGEECKPGEYNEFAAA
jgi:hypothetical protein